MELMNAPRQRQRSAGVSRCRTRAKFHEGCSPARGIAVGVDPTIVGERLVRSLGPRFEEIDAELASLSELRGKPAGTIRITAGEHAVRTILWRALAELTTNYSDIKVEVIVDNGLTDIVAERYDAGIRF